MSNQRPGSAGALLKRVSGRCSDRPEKANGQPGMFCTTRLADDRWQRRVYRHGAVLGGKFWERHVYGQGAVALVSESVAQATARALLRPTTEAQRSTRLVWKGMFGTAVLAIPVGLVLRSMCGLAAQATACLKLWAARVLRKRGSNSCSDRFEGMFREATQKNLASHVFRLACHVERMACLRARGGSLNHLERCSSQCQSVAQTD